MQQPGCVLRLERLCQTIIGKLSIADYKLDKFSIFLFEQPSEVITLFN